MNGPFVVAEWRESDSFRPDDDPDVLFDGKLMGSLCILFSFFK